MKASDKRLTEVIVVDGKLTATLTNMGLCWPPILRSK
jgi:hypothetical protein